MAPKLPIDIDRPRRPARWPVVIGTILLLVLGAVVALQARPGGSPSAGGFPLASLTAAGELPSATTLETNGATRSVTASGAVTLGTAPPPTATAALAPSASPAPTTRLTAAPTPRPTAAPTPRPTAAPTPRPTAAPTPGGGAWPSIGHIYEIVLENHEVGSIVGSRSAPYINSLADRFGLATGYTAVSHPSLPNYLALWSGSTQGVKDDGVHNFSTGATLADQIEARGRSWHVAAENVPPGCYLGSSASGGVDGPGDYARKHEPAISWIGVSTNASRCGNITDFTHFAPGLGNYWFIAPNLCHDMHDCSVSAGDTWLKAFLPRILDSTAFKSDGVIFLTFDEGSSDIGGGGKVATIVISPRARTAFSSSRAHNHYSLVRTIEALWGMPCLANSCSATTLREFFP